MFKPRILEAVICAFIFVVAIVGLVALALLGSGDPIWTANEPWPN